ncbi:transketolase C-terminal domain-containing protein, partial [uncultured Helicobacter sp.]
RDTGWINLCTYNPQEAYDFNLMAFKIAEDKRVRVPIIVNQDGFICSHTAQSVRPFTDEEAYKFIGDYISHNPMLNFSNPVTYGAQTEEDWHFEHKAQLHKGIMDSAQVIEEVFEAFAKKSGRTYKLVETYDIEDAEVAIVALGTSVESARVAAKKARNEKGIKAGVISIRSLRPFPFKQIGEVLKGLKAVACIDRSLPAGTMGMLFNEFSAAALGAGAHLIMSNYIYGLGGRDLTQAHLESIFTELNENAKAGKLTHPLQQMLGLRGPKMSFF